MSLFNGVGSNLHHSGTPPQQPDIDEILTDLIKFTRDVEFYPALDDADKIYLKEAKQALYQRLAAEAVEFSKTEEYVGKTEGYHKTVKVKAVPLSKLAELMGVNNE